MPYQQIVFLYQHDNSPKGNYLFFFARYFFRFQLLTMKISFLSFSFQYSTCFYGKFSYNMRARNCRNNKKFNFYTEIFSYKNKFSSIIKFFSSHHQHTATTMWALFLASYIKIFLLIIFFLYPQKKFSWGLSQFKFLP